MVLGCRTRCWIGRVFGHGFHLAGLGTCGIKSAFAAIVLSGFLAFHNFRKLRPIAPEVHSQDVMSFFFLFFLFSVLFFFPRCFARQEK